MSGLLLPWDSSVRINRFHHDNRLIEQIYPQSKIHLPWPLVSENRSLKTIGVQNQGT